MPQAWRLLLAKLIMVAALACGIIGLVAGLSDKEWKLGVTGWFTGGTLVATASSGRNGAIDCIPDRWSKGFSGARSGSVLDHVPVMSGAWLRQCR